MFSHLRRDRYHCPITIINIVRTKGKAGYLVWKLAGGQGDQDINLPWGSFEITFLFNLLDLKLSVANPLFIIEICFLLTRKYQKGGYLLNEVIRGHHFIIKGELGIVQGELVLKFSNKFQTIVFFFEFQGTYHLKFITKF